MIVKLLTNLHIEVVFNCPMVKGTFDQYSSRYYSNKKQLIWSAVYIFFYFNMLAFIKKSIITVFQKFKPLYKDFTIAWLKVPLLYHGHDWLRSLN